MERVIQEPEPLLDLGQRHDLVALGLWHDYQMRAVGNVKFPKKEYKQHKYTVAYLHINIPKSQTSDAAVKNIQRESERKWSKHGQGKRAREDETEGRNKNK